MGPTVPADTVVHIRLREMVSSYGSKAGRPVSALVIQPVMLGGQVAIPLGAELEGTIVRARRVGLGFASETALVKMDFTQMRPTPTSEFRPIELVVTQLDDSRETVDAEGNIRGIRATASASKMLSGAAISVASVDPMALLFGLSASLGAFRIPESEIIMPPGTELTTKLTAPLAIPAPFSPQPDFLSGDDQRETLTGMMRKLPWRTATENKREPSDITSVLFLGNQDAIIRALVAADWSRSDALGAASTYGVMRSVVENQGYREGPVSTLLLAGQPPVGAWAKTLDTFFARHHLRLFAQPSATFDGSPVFVTSATHDSGIGINKATKTMIHLIDENIDEERDKVVSDMLLTGCVSGVEYVDRPWIQGELKNATGDVLQTDRRMAVLKMNDCTAPRRADEPDRELKMVRAKASAPARVSRNVVLYLRDDAYRGNLGYQGYSAGKAAYSYFHNRRKKDDTPSDKPKTFTAVGQTYTLVSRPKVTFVHTSDDFEDPGLGQPSYQLPGQKRDLSARLDYSISGGYSRFANRTFSNQPFEYVVGEEQLNLIGEFAQSLRSGWTIAPRATIHSWKYVSNEFGYTISSTPLRIRMNFSNVQGQNDVIDGDQQLRQFSYNTLIYAKPNGARFRPYAAVGPVFQLIRLSDAESSTNKLLKFTIKDAGLIVDAYNFGHKPPLEGGGIFQVAFQYGAGYRFAVTPRFFIRSDFRETISSQPDYWTKSQASFQTEVDTATARFNFGKETFGGLLRQRTFTTGFGISF